jgi:uncharacterized protein
MRRLLLALSLAAAASPAWAGFTEGQERFMRDDYAAARAEWTAAAQAGDARAHYGLGVLHWRGLGAEADPIAAARCFAAAARLGYRPAWAALAALAAELGAAERRGAGGHGL